MPQTMTDPLIGKNINDLKKSGVQISDFNPIGMNINDIKSQGIDVADYAGPAQPKTSTDHTRELGPIELIPHTMSTLSNKFMDLGKDTAAGIGKLATDVGRSMSPSGALDLSKDIYEGAKGVVTSPYHMGQSLAKFAGGARNADPEQMSEGTTDFIKEIPNVLGFAGGVEGVASSVKKPIARGVYSKASKSAASSMERALDPRTRELKAIAQEIAPEMIERGIFDVTGGKIDQTLQHGLTKAGVDVIRAENAIPPATPVSMSDIIAKTRAKINDLTIKLEQGDVSGHPEAVAELQKALTELEKFGGTARFNDLIRYKRQLDQGIQESGGYKNTAAAADKIKMLSRRQVADFIREQVNSLDEALAKANADFHFYRKGNDIIDWRDLGEVGEQTPTISRMIRGRSDDMAALSLGYMGGGPAGAAALEGLNLLRQSRGFQSIKSKAMSGVANRTADMFRERNPARLLAEKSEGRPFQMGPGDDSGISVESGVPLVRGYEDVISKGKPSPKLGPNKTVDPSISDTGPEDVYGIDTSSKSAPVKGSKTSSGLTFERVIGDPALGTQRWIYVDSTGRQVTSTRKLD